MNDFPSYLLLSKLAEYLANAGLLSREDDLALTRGDDLSIHLVAHDVKHIQPGSNALFVNHYGRGQRAMRENESAVAAGARAICYEWMNEHPKAIPCLTITQPFRVLSAASALRFGFPARKLTNIGITGTNGKTTTTLMLTRILETAGVPNGLVGSLLRKICDRAKPPTMTTPNAPELQQLLFEMVQAGAQVAVIEVSSHGLIFERVADVPFEIGVITNILIDHTDLHATPEEYRNAKSRLFAALPQHGCALCPADDRLAREAASAAPCPVYQVGKGPGSDVRILRDGLQINARFAAAAGKEPTRLVYKLLQDARHTRTNAAFAAAAAFRLGIPADAIESGLAAFPSLPKRLHTVFRGLFTVVEDMMNPGGLDAAFEQLSRQKLTGPLVVVAAPRGLRGEVINRLSAEAIARGLDRLSISPRPRLVVTDARDVVDPGDIVRADEREAFLEGLGSWAERVGVFGRLDDALKWALDEVETCGTLLLLGAQSMLEAPALLRKLMREHELDDTGVWHGVDATKTAADAAGI